MRLLVLGGTEFLGRALVEAALGRGDEVTTFTRGRTNPDLFPEADRRVGDRDGDLAALEHGDWDAVVDTSGYVPRVVRASCELLAPRVRRYAFVSSISAYAHFGGSLDEDSPLAALEDPHEEDVDRSYGALKAACEGVVRDAFGPRALIVRPGLIVGPHDPTGRFTYWARRLERGGEILAPEADVLRGTVGEYVLKLAASTYPVRSVTVSLADAFAADEVFLTSTTRGVVPIVMLDETPVGTGGVGPIVRDLMGRFRTAAFGV